MAGGLCLTPEAHRFAIVSRTCLGVSSSMWERLSTLISPCDGHGAMHASRKCATASTAICPYCLGGEVCAARFGPGEAALAGLVPDDSACSTRRVLVERKPDGAAPRPYTGLMGGTRTVWPGNETSTVPRASCRIEQRGAEPCRPLETNPWDQ